MALSRSASLPGLMKLGTSFPKIEGSNFKKATLVYKHQSAIDLHRGAAPTDEAIKLAELMKVPSWRLAHTDPPRVAEITEEDLIPKNMRIPKISPAWLKHEKQVLRFYAFFQEKVTERPDENSRYRNVAIMYYMEDGTIRIGEPRVENSGIPQGAFLRRHRVPRPDGQGFVGPDDFRCGEDISFYGRTYHITGCDRFTRWFYEENGIDVGEEEPLVEDAWQKSYKLKRLAEKGGAPMTKSQADQKAMTTYLVGGAPSDKKLTQFLLNDRKVLRFKAFWDDNTLYGSRTYFAVHYFLCDNTVEINEAHCRNSGRDVYPGFMKRAPLHKHNEVNCVPAMLASDAPIYMPEDLKVGQFIDVWNRKLWLYDCDEFTQQFYKDFMSINQQANRIDTSVQPVLHRKLCPPPHTGIGSPEDSLISCQMIVPKAPKVDLVKLMTMYGEVLRFEAKMANGQPEDEGRRLVIAYYGHDDQVMVTEMEQRNSGHMAGKFADKRKIRNPETGEYFELRDFYVGKTVYIAAQPLQIIRADEHCLQFLEARPQEFPWADPVACARRLLNIADHPELQEMDGVEPDRLKELMSDAGVDIVDHEIITLLRKFPTTGPDGNPRVCCPLALQAAY